MLGFSKPHMLQNAGEYEAAVAEIDRLLDADPDPGSAECERLAFLSMLVEVYEDEHDPFDEAEGTPHSVVEFMLEQRGMTRADVYQLMGGKMRTSEFFVGKRTLSIDEVWGLQWELGLPEELLVG